MASVKGSTCVIALQKILCRVDIMFTEKHQGVKKLCGKYVIEVESKNPTRDQSLP